MIKEKLKFFENIWVKMRFVRISVGISKVIISTITLNEYEFTKISLKILDSENVNSINIKIKGSKHIEHNWEMNIAE